MNSFKALTIALILILFSAVIFAVWVFTPQHSGVAYATMLLGGPVVAVLIGWVIGDPVAT